jgi:hypothetical protein
MANVGKALADIKAVQSIIDQMWPTRRRPRRSTGPTELETRHRPPGKRRKKSPA